MPTIARAERFGIVRKCSSTYRGSSVETYVAHFRFFPQSRYSGSVSASRAPWGITRIARPAGGGSPRAAAAPAGGEVLQGAFPGPYRPGLVYLPPGFDESNRYPVVYLLHGMPGSPSEYLYGTQLVEYADEQIAAHTLKPF